MQKITKITVTAILLLAGLPAFASSGAWNFTSTGNDTATLQQNPVFDEGNGYIFDTTGANTGYSVGSDVEWSVVVGESYSIDSMGHVLTIVTGNTYIVGTDEMTGCSNPMDLTTCLATTGAKGYLLYNSAEVEPFTWSDYPAEPEPEPEGSPAIGFFANASSSLASFPTAISSVIVDTGGSIWAVILVIMGTIFGFEVLIKIQDLINDTGKTKKGEKVKKSEELPLEDMKRQTWAYINKDRPKWKK